MNRRLATAILALSVTLVGATATWLLLRAPPAVEPVDSLPAGPPTPSADELEAVELYFPGDGGRLYPETRELPKTGAPPERVRRLVNALLVGPRTQELHAPLPAGTSLGGVDVVDGLVAFIDLQSAEGSERLSAGSRRELLMVYSLVNSVALNLVEVERVGLLWNGTQPPTFAGHVDVTRPLTPDPRLVAGVR